MKKDQIIVAAILAFLATLMVTSAQAGPLVFSNGVQLTDVQIVERQKEGKLPAIVGNSFYEDGKFVMAADSKNPEVRKVQKVREAVRKHKENQDQKRIDRAPAEAARKAAYEAAVAAEKARQERNAYLAEELRIGGSIIDIPADILAEITKKVEPFIAAQTPEKQAIYLGQLGSLETVNDAREFFNEAYGTEADNQQFYEWALPNNGATAAEEGYRLGGATTCALKSLDDGRGCGVGSGT